MALTISQHIRPIELVHQNFESLPAPLGHEIGVLLRGSPALLQPKLRVRNGMEMEMEKVVVAGGPSLKCFRRPQDPGELTGKALPRAH